MMKTRKIKIVNYIFMFITVVWMVIIFIMSHKPADESTKMSHQVGKLFGHIFVIGFDSWDYERQEAFAEKVDHPIRKTAHATEYCLLCIILMEAFSFLFDYKLNGIKNKMPWFITVIYAISDEIHQYFVPGRSCMLTDVLIDASGGFAGFIIVISMMSIAIRIKGAKE